MSSLIFVGAMIFGRTVDLVERSAIEKSRNYLRRKAILNSAEILTKHFIGRLQKLWLALCGFCRSIQNKFCCGDGVQYAEI